MHKQSLTLSILLVFSLVLLAGVPSLAVTADSPPPVEQVPGAPVILRAAPYVDFHRTPPPASALGPVRIQSATITVNYLPNGSTDAFGTPCLTWPTQAQTAFSYAADIWETLINSSVTIVINACWADLESGVLGYGGADNYYRNFTNAPQTDTWYPVALANALSGSDLNGSDAEMHLAYNKDFQDSNQWYFGTDGNTPGTQYDFSSVVLHEIAHGLGFSGSMNVSGGQGSWGGGTDYPISYDRFTEDGSGNALINTAIYPNPSLALANALTSGDIWFDGPNANAANGGGRVQLYSPSPWESGSSYSHLDEVFNGTENALMTYSLAKGESNHNPGPVAMGVLEDVGWTTEEPTPPPSVTSITPASGQNTGSVSVSIAGTDFQNGATVKLTKTGETDIQGTSVVVVSATQITCDFNLTGAATGAWNVVVTNPDDQSDTLTNGFTVTAPPAPDVSIQKNVIGDNFAPGDRITFTLAIANSGNLAASQVVVTDDLPAEVLTSTYASDLSITSGTLLSYTWNVEELSPGESGVITIYGWISPSLESDFSFVNRAFIYDPNDLTPTNNKSSVLVGEVSVYLPVVSRNWPPIPMAPTLNNITPNPSTDGSYTLSWSAGSGPTPTSYDVEENGTVIFTAYANTSRSFSNRSNGTYTYRVRGRNSYGAGPWSSQKQVVVQIATGPTPGFWKSTYEEFYVTTDRAYVDDFAVYVSVSNCGTYKITHQPQEPISNNQFSFSGSFYASGTFNTSTNASGQDGLSNFYISGCGYVSGGPWEWNATWQHSALVLRTAEVTMADTGSPVAETSDSYTVTRVVLPRK